MSKRARVEQRISSRRTGLPLASSAPECLRRGGRAVECAGLENRWLPQGGSWVRIPPPPLQRRRQSRAKRRKRPAAPESSGMETSAGAHPRQQRWRARAEKFEDAFGLVLVLVLVTYVLGSIISDSGWTGVLITLTTTATAIVALTSTHASPLAVRRASIVGAAALILALISAIGGGRGGLNLASFLVLGLLAVGMGAVLQRVMTAQTVTARTIAGAISVYASLGLFFTWLYVLVDRLEGGGFFEHA